MVSIYQNLFEIISHAKIFTNGKKTTFNTCFSSKIYIHIINRQINNYLVKQHKKTLPSTDR